MLPDVDSLASAPEYVCEWEYVLEVAVCCGWGLHTGWIISEQEQSFQTIVHIRGNTCIELASQF